MQLGGDKGRAEARGEATGSERFHMLCRARSKERDASILLLNHEAVRMKTGDSDVPPVAGLDRAAWVRERHPVDLSILRGTALAKLADLFERRHDELHA